MLTAEQRARVRALNDALRQGRGNGRLQVTRGIVDLGADRMGEALRALADFDRFDPDSDPYGEHDFGAFEVDGRQVFFKLDYYAPGFECAASDPSDETTCVRVLTLMLAEEY